MLQTVRDTCAFKQDAIEFALTKQIETWATSNPREKVDPFRARYANGLIEDDSRWNEAAQVIARGDVEQRLSSGWVETRAGLPSRNQKSGCTSEWIPLGEFHSCSKMGACPSNSPRVRSSAR